MLSFTQVAGAVVQVATRPAAAVHSIEALLAQLAEVASRALALLDVAEPAAARITDVVSSVESTATRIDGLADEAARTAAKADKATDSAAGTVAALQPLVDAVATIDPRALIALVEGIPTVLEKLAAQVDHLDQTVAEVGTLLSGIPGAARLAKRGDRLTAR